MADLVFRGTPWGDITVKDSWPPWQRKMWLELLGVPQSPAFVPVFEDQHTVTDDLGNSSALNRDYFADEATANTLAQKLGAVQVSSVKYQGAGGVFSAGDVRERWLVFKDGTACNAGLVAKLYTNSPEDLFPNVAYRAALAAVESARAGGLKLPKE